MRAHFTAETRRLDNHIEIAPFVGLPVYFFDLERVLAHTGSMLSRDPERLRSVCEHHLAALTASEILLFSDSGFYLIVHSSGAEAALAIANRVNVALQRLFFGTESLAPQQFATLFQAVSANPDNADEAEATIEDNTGKSRRQRANVPADVRDAYAHLAAQGTFPEQNVELRFVPIHDLQRGRVTTFFCSPVFCVQHAPLIYGYGAFQGVSRRDYPYIDRAILAHAMKFARRLAASGTVAAIGTSVNYETLAWSKGREIYQQALRAAGVADCPFLVLKIEEIPQGVTAGGLADIVSAVRPFVKRVFVHLPDTTTPFHRCGYLGACGLVLSLPARPSHMTVMGAAKWLMRTCEEQTALSCIDHIDSDKTLDMVRLAGIRFGAGNVFGAREFCGDAEPMAVENFMEEVARSAPASTRTPPRMQSIVRGKDAQPSEAARF